MTRTRIAPLRRRARGVATGILVLSTMLDPAGAATASTLRRAGNSIDLLCSLARRDARPTPRAERRHASACETPGRARVVPIGDDRRRALVLPADEALDANIETPSPASLRFSIAVLGRDHRLDVTVTLSSEDETAQWSGTAESTDGWKSVEIPVPPHVTSGRLTVRSKAPTLADRDARLALAAPRLVLRRSSPSHTADNILLYVIDTLRADHLSTYGAPRNPMPNLDALARRAVVFDRAYSTAAQTRPATASLLTGLYPSGHRARRGRGLARVHQTLAEVLRTEGWATWAFVANGNVFAPGFAFDQGFDRFETIRGPAPSIAARAGAVHARLRAALDESPNEPFFAYLHVVDPHAPYEPPPEGAGRYRDGAYRGPIEPTKTQTRSLERIATRASDVQHVRDLYDEELAAHDAAFGHLLELLRELDLEETTTLLVVGDHGEEFAEHGGWEHGGRLYEEQIRVPVVLRVGGTSPAPAGRVRTPISLVDLAPTLLGLYGLGFDAPVHGRDRSPDVDGRTADLPALPIYAEETRRRGQRELQTWIDGPWKLIRHSESDEGSAATFELFDLRADPSEQRDLRHDRPDRLRSMAEALARHARSVARPPSEAPAPALDPRTRAHLMALGYLLEAELPSADPPSTVKNEPFRTFTKASSGTLQNTPRKPAERARPSSNGTSGAATAEAASP